MILQIIGVDGSTSGGRIGEPAGSVGQGIQGLIHASDLFDSVAGQHYVHARLTGYRMLVASKTLSGEFRAQALRGDSGEHLPVVNRRLVARKQ